MSSTSTVNFSLRQNKAIERNIAFDAYTRVVIFSEKTPSMWDWVLFGSKISILLTAC